MGDTPLRNLPKHQKYAEMYKAGDVYWGLGIEHETYVETPQRLTVSRDDLRLKRRAERYSVNYYSVYKPAVLDSLFALLPPTVEVPVLANAHTLQAVDLAGEHRTTYEAVPKPNPKFSGRSVIEFLKERRPDYFAAEYEGAYIFDGDTVEFVSQNFYCATVDQAVQELELAEAEFERELAVAMADASGSWLAGRGPFRLASRNWPWACYLTNRSNYAMFNNGTIHINMTLPTVLDASGAVADMEEFTNNHRMFIRAIQWLEPLWVALYGSPDPWSAVSPRFAKGSQRLAVSRYIGLGTYDTDAMPVGKILTVNRAGLVGCDWMTGFYEKTDYVPLAEVGLDINFNKHHSHGVELRIFDQMPLADVSAVCRVLVSLADVAMGSLLVRDPRKSACWQGLAGRCLLEGRDTVITAEEQAAVAGALGLACAGSGPKPVADFYKDLVGRLATAHGGGMCADAFLRGVRPRKGKFGLLPAIKMLPVLRFGPKVGESDAVKADAVKADAVVSAAELPSVPVVGSTARRFWCC